MSRSVFCYGKCKYTVTRVVGSRKHTTASAVVEGNRNFDCISRSSQYKYASWNFQHFSWTLLHYWGRITCCPAEPKSLMEMHYTYETSQTID